MPVSSPSNGWMMKLSEAVAHVPEHRRELARANAQVAAQDVAWKARQGIIITPPGWEHAPDIWAKHQRWLWRQEEVEEVPLW